MSLRGKVAIVGYGEIPSMRHTPGRTGWSLMAEACRIAIADAGLRKKGEIGDFFDSVDTTYKGSFPINTDGGQLSGGQPGIAGGLRHVVEAARQIMGRAEDRQIVKHDLCLLNG